ncbi:hypothetical protein EVAR_7877_1 [Eumeta japonica]|uniref:Uncharacterized protein n=1 Tax=Eumeta variegata TaxID=151549 RepID=A0A4C1TVH3_EUMVA|nr:hypothetical protein EVAR_7877_1 [Eumeta japonica]
MSLNILCVYGRVSPRPQPSLSFAIVPSIIPRDRAGKVLEVFNSIDNHIQFTLELEDNSKLPYLDVMAWRTERGAGGGRGAGARRGAVGRSKGGRFRRNGERGRGRRTAVTARYPRAPFHIATHSWAGCWPKNRTPYDDGRQSPEQPHRLAVATVRRTKLCRCELRANYVMRRYDAPRPFLLARVPILRRCVAFVTNFTAAVSAARGRPIIVEWERDAAFGGPLSRSVTHRYVTERYTFHNRVRPPGPPPANPPRPQGGSAVLIHSAVYAALTARAGRGRIRVSEFEDVVRMRIFCTFIRACFTQDTICYQKLYSSLTRKPKDVSTALAKFLAADRLRSHVSARPGSDYCPPLSAPVQGSSPPEL